MNELPTEKQERISQLETAYQEALLNQQNKRQIKQSLSRLVWAYVYSPQQQQRKKGIDLAREEVRFLEIENQCDSNEYREMLYYLAVGQFNSGQLGAARSTIKKYLKNFQASSQGQILLSKIGGNIQKKRSRFLGVMFTIGLVVFFSKHHK
eukprot:TRINITY_DN15019_c0_g1_i16.p3 TRINITY_DN15019_c0_g1~~TRINITY_DN15019_c0_g1_i16.p3  ORF type:complete len:151 (-),score=12.28 TRINITY_DN15019_c0_g1_i16:677-1129(-)